MSGTSGLPVPTAALSGLTYDPVRRMLTAGTGDGPKRHYLEVPQEIYGLLSTGPEPGVFFRQFVDSGRYPYRFEVSPEPAGVAARAGTERPRWSRRGVRHE